MDTSQIFNFLFEQYSEYHPLDIALEITGVVFGLVSVLFSRKNNVLVFPTGIVSTIIFTYLLFKWSLLGDMLINFYYFVMSIYGWYLWSLKKDHQEVVSITRTTKAEQIKSIFIFLGVLIFIVVVYVVFDKFNTWTAYIDTVTTGIFFVGMWLMARRKIENWICWLIGNLISIPLYFYKGLTFTSFQYIGFTLLAIFGYLEWKKYLDKTKINSSN